MKKNVHPIKGRKFDVKSRYAVFIKRAKEKFGDKFDYSKVEYKTAKDKVTIICPIHGEFQKFPDKHLEKNSHGCNSCWADVRITLKRKKLEDTTNLKISEQEFLDRANLKYNNKFKYIIENWQGLTIGNIIVICPIHGEFTVTPKNHINKLVANGCQLCGHESRSKTKTKSYETVCHQFSKVHNNFYLYPDSNKAIYVNKKTKIKIICPIHGIFEKKAQKHLLGQGCFQCKIEDLVHNNILPGGYYEDYFNAHPELKNSKAILYYLEINKGQYYKIGITTKQVKYRIKSLKSTANQKGQLIEIKIIASKNLSLYDGVTLERHILITFKEFRKYTKWSTELFTVNIFNQIQHHFT